jgi:hypothetical protein
MPPDTAMTGTFQAKLPSDLLSAIKQGVNGPGKDLNVRAMKPSLVERVIGMFSGKKARAARRR